MCVREKKKKENCERNKEITFLCKKKQRRNERRREIEKEDYVLRKLRAFLRNVKADRRKGRGSEKTFIGNT